MSDFKLTAHEADLLRAALSDDRATAVRAWNAWSEAEPLEDAPHHELRLLPTVFANLSKVAPDLTLPPRLRGNSRATFTFSRLITHEALPALEALATFTPVIVTKGAAFCARFNAWSFRQIGDVDVHVPRRHLERSLATMAALGWTPKHGMTLSCLIYRTSPRRNSWNMTKEHGDIDLHWRFLNCTNSKAVESRFWDTAEMTDLFGQAVLTPCAEFSAVGSMQHGLGVGTRADALQTLIDCWFWLPRCDHNKLAGLVSLADMSSQYDLLRAAYNDAGLQLGEWLPTPSNARSSRRHRSARPEPGIRLDDLLVRHPWLYRLWSKLGRRCVLERLILRHFGPISKPPQRTQIQHWEYDLRDRAVVDEIGGPGWGWPEPENGCLWAEQDDNRLLLDLPLVQDYVAILSLSIAAKSSPNPRVALVVNGHLLRTLDLRSLDRTRFAIPIPRSLLFGPWVEFSFRPVNFAATTRTTDESCRSLPAVRLQMIPADQAATALVVKEPTDLQIKVARGEEPYVSKFGRIETKIEQSAFKNDHRLPADFDPTSYVLLYEDLFNAEVDPYWHFAVCGHDEGRAWM